MSLRILLALMFFAGIIFAANSYVIAIDGSGSMAYKIGDKRKFTVAQDSVICTLKVMRPEDEVAIFVFEDAGKITLVHNFTRDKDELISAVDAATTKFGSTELSEGLNVSATYLRMYAANYNRYLIVISDGGGANAALYADAAYYRSVGVTKIHTVGLGIDTMVKRGVALESIAKSGGGNFYSTMDYYEPCSAVKAAYEDTAVSSGKVTDWCPMGMLILLGLALAYVSIKYLTRQEK